MAKKTTVCRRNFAELLAAGVGGGESISSSPSRAWRKVPAACFVRHKLRRALLHVQLPSFDRANSNKKIKKKYKMLRISCQLLFIWKALQEKTPSFQQVATLGGWTWTMFTELVWYLKSPNTSFQPQAWKAAKAARACSSWQEVWTIASDSRNTNINPSSPVWDVNNWHDNKRR